MSLQVGKNFKKSREKDHQKLITIVNGQTSLSKAKRAQAQGQGRAGAGNCTRNMLQPNPTSKDKKRDPRSLLTLAPLMWDGPGGHIPALLPLSPCLLEQLRAAAPHLTKSLTHIPSPARIHGGVRPHRIFSGSPRETQHRSILSTHTSKCLPCSSSCSGGVILGERAGSGAECVKHFGLCSPHGG